MLHYVNRIISDIRKGIEAGIDLLFIEARKRYNNAETIIMGITRLYPPVILATMISAAIGVFATPATGERSYRRTKIGCPSIS